MEEEDLMGDPEEGIEEQSPNRAGSSLLIRLFGVFAVLFGLPYLIQGVSALIVFSARYGLFFFHYQLAVILFDMLIGLASIVIGVGLFFRKEWARKAWLAFLIVLLLVHFHMTIIQILAGFSNMTWLYKWIAVVVVVSIISWAYLTKAKVKAGFH